MADIQCPDCKGETVLRVLAHMSHGGCETREMQCPRCQGSGAVPEAMREWMADGERLRDRRVYGTPYRNLRDEAARLGCSARILSSLENGRLPGAAALLEGEG